MADVIFFLVVALPLEQGHMNRYVQPVYRGLLLGNPGSTNGVIVYITTDLPIGVVRIGLHKPCLAHDLLAQPVRKRRAKSRVYVSRFVFNEIYFYRFYRIRN